MTVARIACTDKLLQIYLIGLKILKLALALPICGPHLNQKIVAKEASQLTLPLLSKVEELNFKAREVSEKALLGLYRNQAMDEGKLVEVLIEITDKKGQKADKLPERLIIGRLELILMLSIIRHSASQTWDWVKPFEQLVVPSLLS